MIKVKKGNIQHMRGDTACLNVNLTRNGEPYEMQEGDSLIFSIKRKTTDSNYVLRKTFDKNQIILNHADTNSLQPGSYVYDIQLQTSIGLVNTIGPAKYSLLADVTRE